MNVSVVIDRNNEKIDFYKNGLKQGASVNITSAGTTNPGSDFRY
jgi:hypothetical protein